ncbi:MAG: COG3650 family protein [Cypionkella sp.]
MARFVRCIRHPGSLVVAAALALAGCEAPPTTGADAPGAPAVLDDDPAEATRFDAIGEGETVRFTGTEPFWGGQVSGDRLTYATPEDPDGIPIPVARFAGRGGVSWSGTHAGARFTLAVTPGRCSDGMSDRIYPFVATLEVSGEQRSGCAWTERRPFTGSPRP